MADNPSSPVNAETQHYKELQKAQAWTKENEEKWQDDLSRWKSRRRGAQSDTVRTREGPEHAGLIASAASAGNAETLQGMQEERDGRELGAPIRDSSASPSVRRDVFSELQPRSRSLPPRSYTVDSPYPPVTGAAVPSVPSVTGDSSCAGALSPDSTSTPTAATPPSIQSNTGRAASDNTSSPSTAVPDQNSSTTTDRSSSTITDKTSTDLTNQIGAAVTDQTSTSFTERVSTAVAKPTSTTLNSCISTSVTNLTDTTLTDWTSTAAASSTGSTRADQIGTALTDSTSADLDSQTSTASDDRTSGVLTNLVGASKSGESSAGSVNRASEPSHSFGRPMEHRSPGPLYNHNSMDTKPGLAQVTALLPGGSRRSDSSRLAFVVSPRPFGTQSTRIASLPKPFAMEGSHKRFNGEMNRPQSSAALNRYSQFLTSEDEARSPSNSVPSSNEDEEEGTAPGPHKTCSTPRTGSDLIQPKLVSPVSSVSESCTLQGRYSDMRISLNQKPNGSQDFGFQTSRDSTGIFVKSVQQGSLAERSDLRVGDEILAVDGRRASEMSREQREGSMDASLQLDVRRNGQESSSENHINASNDFNSQPSSETTMKMSHSFSNKSVNDLESKGMNGGLHDESVTMRNKEPQLLSLKNFKRRSEFFEKQGGSESAISDLQVPSISTASNRRSWDPMEERRRQEKWQQEQERLLQEKYKRDQEKLEEEWRRAQQEAVSKGSSYHEEEQKILDTETRSLSPLSPVSPLSQTTPPPWGDPSRLVESKALEAGSKQQGEEKRGTGEEQRSEGEELEWQKKLEEEEQPPGLGGEEGRKTCQDAAKQQQFREQSRSQEQEQRKGESDGFAKILPEMAPSDRVKSKSTPDLDEVDKPAEKAAGGGVRVGLRSQEAQRKRNRPLSQAELDRLQILEEMKKRTQLLTDSSWIRQRSANIYKEPICLGAGMRRYESLDNLNTARSWRQSPWPPGSSSSSSRPQSAVSSSASSCGYTRSISYTLPTSHSTGSLRQGPWFQPSPTAPAPPTDLSEEPDPEACPQSQPRTSASTASPTSGDQDQEPKSEYETSISTAAPVTSHSKMDGPPPCDLTTQQQTEGENTANEEDV
ncbi:hypothetical protein MATL_G00178040 [Megalops atlanticus]|uniref:PDZ domain-containing protein n=1 Tax=Megalops atlanticus TaxID=7932 RepID=A0A9D3PRP4_MEGAT|nr:hypothetical protein MATL_G00178040 [Megalops atlanticus]